ncbi:acyl carrier protein [bacterium]|nr:acyl carrier protein [bacterium]
MSRTRNAIKKIAIERLDIKLTDEIIDSGQAFKDIGVDSLDAIELVVSVEDELDIELSDERLDGIENIKQLADYLVEFD